MDMMRMRIKRAKEPLPPLIDAIEALVILQSFEMSREDDSRSTQTLDQLTREVMALMANTKTQTTIDGFFYYQNRA